MFTAMSNLTFIHRLDNLYFMKSIITFVNNYTSLYPKH